MSLTIVTCTHDRSLAFSCLENCIARQTICWDHWIVVSDGQTCPQCNLGQILITRPASPPGHESHRWNLLTALANLPRNADKIIIAEDDDYLAPDYLETASRLLDHYEVVGGIPAHYYNVSTRRCLTINNHSHASLGQTAFCRRLASRLEDACRKGAQSIDLRFWSGLEGQPGAFLGKAGGHVSVKGLPGTKGLGRGHDQNFGRPDPDGSVARAWGLPEVYLGGSP